MRRIIQINPNFHLSNSAQNTYTVKTQADFVPVDSHLVRSTGGLSSGEYMRYTFLTSRSEAIRTPTNHYQKINVGCSRPTFPNECFLNLLQSLTEFPRPHLRLPGSRIRSNSNKIFRLPMSIFMLIRPLSSAIHLEPQLRPIRKLAQWNYGDTRHFLFCEPLGRDWALIKDLKPPRRPCDGSKSWPTADGSSRGPRTAWGGEKRKVCEWVQAWPD